MRDNCPKAEEAYVEDALKSISFSTFFAVVELSRPYGEEEKLLCSQDAERQSDDITLCHPYAEYMFDILLDLLFPRQSLTGAEGSFITKFEQENLRLTPLLLSTNMLRQRGLRYIDDIVAAGQYDESYELKKMILTYKYKRIPAFSDALAMRMTAAMHGLLLPTTKVLRTTPVLSPVPLHWSRLHERGFNQAEQLAERIARTKGWQMEELLFRVRRTGHQAHRTRSERLTALKNAFAVKPNLHVPAWVILIDDLSTTGATLDECAKMLKAAGAQRVSGLVAATG